MDNRCSQPIIHIGPARTATSLFVLSDTREYPGQASLAYGSRILSGRLYLNVSYRLLREIYQHLLGVTYHFIDRSLSARLYRALDTLRGGHVKHR